jgi:TraG P-loop domain
MRLAVAAKRRMANHAPTTAWPTAAVDDDAFRVEGRFGGGFELAPVNLELMAEAEREATLENLAALYDAIPGPFQLLSVPTGRSPVEHLDAVRPAVDPQGERVFRPYAANYHEISTAPARPPRRTVLLVDAATEPELARALDLVRRVAEERDFGVRRLDGAAIAALWGGVARVGASYEIHAGHAKGPDLVAALHLGRRWSAEVAPGWLAGLLAIDGLAAASMRVLPLSRAEAMTYMTARLRIVRASDRLAVERGELADVERERLDATAVAARRSVAAGAGRIYLVDIVLLLEALDRASLSERLETLRLEGRSRGVDIEAATLRIGEAWASALPGPAPRSISERNLDSASLAASLLNSASDLYEPAGHLYGRARTTGAPIVLDRFAHESHNAIVLGQTGKGKTMFTGAEVARCFMRGIRVLGVDPLGDYRRLVDTLGGTYIELGAGSGINPFALGETRTEAAFVTKLALVGRLVAAMAGGLSRDERPALDRALRATYEAAGIGPDPSTHDRRPPTLAGLVEQLSQIRDGQRLAQRLERWATGSLASIFAADAGLPQDERLLVVGLNAIGDPDVRAVAQLAALSVLWDAIRRDKERKLVVVDEAWKVMRQPSGAEFVEELARSARHYHAGLQLSTQDIAEFLRSDFGEAIVKQCDIRILLGQTPEGVDALGRYFDLTAAERRSLLHARPGEGLLFVGQSHVAFEAKVSKREYEWLTTRPADLLGQSHSRYDAPNST